MRRSPFIPEPVHVRTGRLLDAVVDLLLPPICLGCGERIAPGSAVRLVCARCRTRLRAVPSPGCGRCGAPQLATARTADPACAECGEWPPALARARAACVLKPPANALVRALKYEGWHTLADPLAARMAKLVLPEAAARARVCVPVPVSRRRLRERGYNQAELLARAFARRTGRTVVQALDSVERAASQTTLQPVGRRANVAGAFRAHEVRCRALQGRDVILIDDVLTTGATASECARVLGAAGIAHITLITFARALDARRLTSNEWSSDP